MDAFLLHESVGKPRRQFSVTLRASGKAERGRTKQCKVSSLRLETWAQLSVSQLAFIVHLKMKIMLFLCPRIPVWLLMGGPLVRKRSCYRTSFRSVLVNAESTLVGNNHLWVIFIFVPQIF